MAAARQHAETGESQTPAVAEPAAAAAGAQLAALARVNPALARAMASGAPVSNRGVARMVLARKVAAPDLVAIAGRARRAGSGWNGSAHKLVWELVHAYAADKASVLAGSRYEPAQGGIGLAGATIVIGDDAIARVAGGHADAVGKELAAALAALPSAAPAPTAAAAAAATEEPAATPQPATLGHAFRAEIVKWLETFYAQPSVEGAGTGFDELLGGHASVEATRRSHVNYTTCNDTTIQLFNRAAIETNVRAGTPRHKVMADYKRIGIVTVARDFGAEAAAKAAGAWVPASDGGKPEKGDIVLFVSPAGGTFPQHIGFFYGTASSKSSGAAAQPDGTEVWITIDGGQGKKGTWGAKPAEPDPKNPAAYVADTGKEIISKRERYYWPETGLIEGEPNQFNKLKKVHGWIKVDKLVAEPSP